ncbi:MAG TPA: O-methyltransferase [Actinomycetota bacterium]|nr:O-methyltransferase [Actinomycetota bacterium]
MDIVDPRVESYLRTLLAGEQEIADEMERAADERDFPIVGRTVGVTLEVLARAIGARRVLELGSGYGYSALWFARAVGDGGEVHMTDGDEDNQRQAMQYLRRAGLADRVTPHVGNALDIIDELDGEFDVVFCDIDKGDYPDAWRKASERIRPGGLYLCDNVLWDGNVALRDEEIEDQRRGRLAPAIREHNRMAATDPRFRTTIIPTRDGVLAALRVA